MGTVITALIIIGFIAGVAGLLVWVNNRDKREDAKKNPDVI